MFERFIGIDYSGASTPESRLAGLQVYESSTGLPWRVEPPAAAQSRARNWNRREIGEWLIEQARGSSPFICGIDHGLSFPEPYFTRNNLRTWPDFLSDFHDHWPTDETGATVEALREGNSRSGSSAELRLCERWTCSAKSVFLFDVQGSVAKSTHAGLPWIKRIREDTGGRVHFWPYDGWEVPTGKSVIAESYPSLFRRRSEKEQRSVDEHDAWSVANWLSTMHRSGRLEAYLTPALTEEERRCAALEGWILGVL